MRNFLLRKRWSLRRLPLFAPRRIRRAFDFDFRFELFGIFVFPQPVRKCLDLFARLPLLRCLSFESWRDFSCSASRSAANLSSPRHATTSTVTPRQSLLSQYTFS